MLLLLIGGLHVANQPDHRQDENNRGQSIYIPSGESSPSQVVLRSLDRTHRSDVLSPFPNAAGIGAESVSAGLSPRW